MRSGVLFCVLPTALGGVVVGLIVAVAVTGSSGAGAGVLAGAAVLAVVLSCGVLVLGIYLLVVTASVGPARLAIRAHGVSVGSTSPRPIPFATMDPGRMQWITSPWGGRHVVTLGRRRVGVGRDGILLNGTDGPAGVEDPESLGTIYDASPTAQQVATPFVWWYLVPEDPRGFLRDLEAAMVADGYPVRGLAGHVSARRGAVPFRRSRGERFPRRVPGDRLWWRPHG